MEGVCETMTKKHAMEYLSHGPTKLEKRLAFMKEEDDKAKKVDVDRMVQETAGLKQRERMLKARVEAAEEELSRKRNQWKSRRGLMFLGLKGAKGGMRNVRKMLRRTKKKKK